MSKIVRYEVDLNNLPPLTEEQQAELKALAAMPDESIDYSDVPPLGDKFWKRAVRNPLYKPTKTSTTVRVDSDVMLWLKSKGKGYQTRLNEILRKAMVEEINEAHDH
ncbi:MAG: cytoplasmic protein [Ferrovum myxofaciens]|uniref:BrnA antitoxin family protein n=1 Tax=Ferrovum myxofaciens TaxID=416213 RepID=UPI00235460CB|nr:BrnA antitoxin family protein [Ferrovum myxofaciens]QKE41687.1 MAG: cytoplasmic protein [Ferrovum myxofaciens]